MIPSVDFSVRVTAGGATDEASIATEVDVAPPHLRVGPRVPTARVEPGAELDVDNAHGKPAHAEVTLFAADEGSLQLTYYRMLYTTNSGETELSRLTA